MAGDPRDAQLRGSLDRIAKLNEHLDEVWRLKDGDPEKSAGIILACRLQNDVIEIVLRHLLDQPDG